jgi:hypothetical protein
MFAPEGHFHPQAIKKDYKKPDFQPDPWDNQFLGMPEFPPCSLSLLSSTNKTFLTSAAGVSLC